MSETKRTSSSTTPQDLLAVLGKEFSIRLLNASPSGCLLQTNSPIEVGTVATLRVALDGRDFIDDVQVVRCQPVEGAGARFNVGAQFLWTNAPGRLSLRQAMMRLPAD